MYLGTRVEPLTMPKGGTLGEAEVTVGNAFCIYNYETRSIVHEQELTSPRKREPRQAWRGSADLKNSSASAKRL